jgi:hypothetical protein
MTFSRAPRLTVIAVLAFADFVCRFPRNGTMLQRFFPLCGK